MQVLPGTEELTSPADSGVNMHFRTLCCEALRCWSFGGANIAITTAVLSLAFAVVAGCSESTVEERAYFSDGTEMYCETLSQEWRGAIGASSVGSFRVIRGRYRNPSGEVIARVTDGDGVRVLYYENKAQPRIRKIQCLTGGFASGPSILFEESGALMAYVPHDSDHSPDGPAIAFRENGMPKRLTLFAHGRVIRTFKWDADGQLADSTAKEAPRTTP